MAPESKNLTRMIKKIAIIGPESTGKSTLCQRLADVYKTQWVPEYAREYLTEHGMPYNYEALLDIAKGQLALEDKHFNELTEKHTPFPTLQPLFIDTEMYVMKVWAEFVFNKCHQFIIDKIVERQYDLYLLCNIDLPWSPDVLREYPDPLPRQQLFRMYQDILINQSTPWTVVSGDTEQRLQSGINAINKIL
jgi:NadR type nicotinamide-nucleotide adenylyltransferase